MRHIEPRSDWPESWKGAYEHDQQEVYGPITNPGYAYAYENRRRKTFSLLTAAVPTGARILDIAAAQGNFSLTLAEMGYQVTWNDLQAELIGYVQQKYERGDVHFVPGNAIEVSFPSLFDAVLITEIIEHVARPDKFLEKVAGLVMPGGCIVMSTPNGAYLRNTLPRFSDCPDPSVYESVQFQPDAEGHIFLLYPDEIRKLATGAGLVVEELLFFTNPLTNGHMKTSRLLRVMPRAMVDAIESMTQRLPGPLAQRLLIQVAARLRKPSPEPANY